jgi:hypothetical protein
MFDEAFFNSRCSIVLSIWSRWRGLAGLLKPRPRRCWCFAKRDFHVVYHRRAASD